MIEIFVISYKTTGFIKSTGIIDREWDSANLDGSTISEKIESMLLEDSKLVVEYLADQKLPDEEKDKMEDKKIVSLTEADKQKIKDEKPKSRLELLEARVTALENK